MCLNGLDVGRDPVSFFLFVSPAFSQVRTTLVYLGTLAFFFAGFMLFMEIDKMGIVGTICNAICQVALVLLVYGRYETLWCWMKEWLVKHCRI